MTTLKKKIFGDKKEVGTSEVNVCKLCGRWDCPQMHSEKSHTYIGGGKWKLKNG